VFDDGPALFDAVVSYGLEGIVAKRRAGVYRSGYRSWTKVKNPSDWRRDSEITQMQRSRERRARLRQRPEVSRVDLLRVSFLVGHLVDRPDSAL
jgi:ATP-dependent DNA ligase